MIAVPEKKRKPLIYTNYEDYYIIMFSRLLLSSFVCWLSLSTLSAGLASAYVGSRSGVPVETYRPVPASESLESRPGNLKPLLASAYVGTRAGVPVETYRPLPSPEPFDGPYFSIFGGYLSPAGGLDGYKDAADHGGFGGVEFGWAFGLTPSTSLMLEAELLGAGFEAYDAVAVGVGALMHNVMVRADAGRVGIYGGAGLGFYAAQLEEGYSVYGEDETSGFAWQALVGVDVEVASFMDVFVEYRYLSLEDAVEGEPLRQHLVGGGLRFNW